ncbi:MAG: YigZ family protein [Flavobacterium sp.]|nr:YigZ family protein [Flavobacterium sp.]
MHPNDTYKTLAEATEETLLKEKNSKFLGYAYPITSEDEIKSILVGLRKQHPNAVHFCYAYQLGTEQISYRANDDGEPSGSAGTPIYGQIQSYGITNVLLVIVRYFGGVKLGVGGLISAYKMAAQQTLESASVIEKTINVTYVVQFNYAQLNKVMRVIKEKKLTILNQKMDMQCEIELSSRKSAETNLLSAFENLYEIVLKKKS